MPDDAAAELQLREITLETVREICALSGTLPANQRKHVADNALSLAEAHFVGGGAWPRAMYVGDEPVGFIMLHHEPDEVFLWRLMVAGPHQRKGYGRRAVELVMEYLKAQGVTELVTSCVPDEDGPKGFYERMGFVPTGKMVGKEQVMVRKL